MTYIDETPENNISGEEMINILINQIDHAELIAVLQLAIQRATFSKYTNLFVMNREIYNFVPTVYGTVEPELVPQGEIWHILVEQVQPVDKYGNPKLMPPQWASFVFKSPDRYFRSVEMFSTFPKFTQHGHLLSESGYFPEQKAFLKLKDGVELPEVPDAPTSDDLELASSHLDLLFQDFPFADNASRTNSLAALVAIIAREMIDGPCPMLLIDKPTPGTGGTLLAETIVRAGTSTTPSLQSEATDQNEWRKKLTSIYRRGSPAIIFDNIRRRMDSAALCSVLTTSVFEDRILGQSQVLKMRARALIIATGNNVSVSDEIARRTMLVSLDRRVDRPSLYQPEDGFLDLRSHVAEYQGTIFWSLCVLVQNWIRNADCAQWSGETIGSFESFCNVVGGILEAAGYEDFLGNYRDFQESPDLELESRDEFISAWQDKFGDKNVGVRDLICLLGGMESPFIFAGRDATQQRRALGQWLRKHTGQIILGFRIVKLSNRGGSARYELHPST